MKMTPERFRENFEVTGDVTDAEIEVMIKHPNRNRESMAHAIFREPHEVWPDRFWEDGKRRTNRQLLKWRTDEYLRRRSLQQNPDNADR